MLDTTDCKSQRRYNEKIIRKSKFVKIYVEVYNKKSFLPSTKNRSINWLDDNSSHYLLTNFGTEYRQTVKYFVFEYSITQSTDFL